MKIIDRFINLFSHGDKSCIEGLCSRFADRLVFVPIVDEAVKPDQSQPGRFAVDVLCLENEEFPLIPAFTTEKNFRVWCENNSHSPPQVLSLLGGDLCAALGQAKGVAINPMAESQATLDPTLVNKVAQSGFDEFYISTQENDYETMPDPRPSDLMMTENPEILHSTDLINKGEEQLIPLDEEIAMEEGQGEQFANDPLVSSTAFIMLDENMVQEDSSLSSKEEASGSRTSRSRARTLTGTYFPKRDGI